MATMIVVGLVIAFGALYFAMAVTPMALEEINSRSIVTKRSTSPVSFERQVSGIAPAHEAHAA